MRPHVWRRERTRGKSCGITWWKCVRCGSTVSTAVRHAPTPVNLLSHSVLADCREESVRKVLAC